MYIILHIYAYIYIYISYYIYICIYVYIIYILFIWILYGFTDLQAQVMSEGEKEASTYRHRWGGKRICHKQQRIQPAGSGH